MSVNPSDPGQLPLEGLSTGPGPWRLHYMYAHWPWLVKRTLPGKPTVIVRNCETEDQANTLCAYYNQQYNSTAYFVEKYDPKSLSNHWQQEV